jgi:hypothetical protein
MRLRTVAIVWLIVALPALLRAQAGDKVVANQLFAEGKKLMADGEIKEACAKLEESLAALAQLGVRLRLADCYERDRRFASAWAEYRAAASMASRMGDKREALARQRSAALARRLPKLAFTMQPGSTRQDMDIAVDGRPIARELVERGMPIDPGPHQVTASAPGFQTVAAAIDAVEGKTTTVEVPVLEPLPPPPRPAPSASVALRPEGDAQLRADPGRSRRRLGLIVGAAGAGVVGVGLVFGLLARAKVNDAKHDGSCNDDLECTPAGADKVNEAQTLGNLSTASVTVGLAAIATGTVLYLTAAKRRTTLGVSAPTSGSAMLTIRGSF